MPQGSKSSYSSKQKREAAHIEKSYKKRGVGEKEAAERAWRTVNKQDGGAKKKSRSKTKSTSRSKSRPSKAGKKQTTAKSSSRATKSGKKR